MASPLRNPLSGLVWAAMAVIYLPLLPASGMLLAPAFSLSNWATLFADPQLRGRWPPRWFPRLSRRWALCLSL